MELEKDCYSPYLSILRRVYPQTENVIIKHSIAVASLVNETCVAFNIHTEIKKRAIKLALIHDIGKEAWLQEKRKGNIYSEYELGKKIVKKYNISDPNICYIFYLLKYLDYTILNGASFISFPLEAMIVCYADLQTIETERVTFKAREEYVLKRYFKHLEPKEFKVFWHERELFYKKFLDNIVKSNFLNNSYLSLAFHTGGWLYENEYTFLHDLAIEASKTDCNFLEVGSWRGKSTILIAGALKKMSSKRRLYCVDDWQGGTDKDCLRLAKNANIYYEFSNNIELLSGQIEPIVGLSTDDDVINILPNNLGLIFLDGAHDYDTIKQEIQIYKSKLVKDGIFCLHDVDNPNYPGVRQAINEYLMDGTFVCIGQESYLAAYKRI